MENVIQMLPNPESLRCDLDIFRAFSTPQLKAMWDREPYAVFCDEIHRVMNERGEGHYVAV